MLHLLAIFSYFLVSQGNSKLVITANDSVRVYIARFEHIDTLLRKGQKIVLIEPNDFHSDYGYEAHFCVICNDFRRVKISLNGKVVPLSLLTENFSRLKIFISNSGIEREKAYKKERENEKKIAEELKRMNEAESKKTKTNNQVNSSNSNEFVTPWSVVHPEMKGKKLNWNQGCNCWLDPISDKGFRYIDVEGDKSKKKWVRIR